ncbi:MAG: prepilin peptidase [Leucobacter sp.]
MTPLLLGAGVLGLLIGSFLNVVIWRVPRGQSLLPASRCPGCGSAITPLQNVPVVSWLALRGRCARCGRRIGIRYPLIELGTAVAFVLVAWWYVSVFAPPPQTPAAAWWSALLAYLWLAGAGIALTAIDLELKRLPDPIVLPSVAVLVVLLSAAASLNGDWVQVFTVIGAAAALFAAYLLIVLLYPAGLGGGDVKLAPLIGAATGYLGWAAVAVGAFAGFLIGALIGLALVAARRGGRKTAVPFGPSMLAGAWIGIVCGSWIMDAYLSLFGLG